MLSGFCVYHSKKSDHQGLELPEGFWHMGTCMRSIVVTESSQSAPKELQSYDRMMGEEAYEFLLEVICGLQSLLMGETEILGQFKEFCKKNESEFSSQIKEIVQSLLRDSKFVRSRYLQNLGCSSYGSLLRKDLKSGEGKLVFIGAGLLVKDILPWLNKKNIEICIYTRKPEQHQDLLKIGENISLHSYNELPQESGGCLVIAAPVEKKWLKENLKLDSFDKIYDLRGTSDKDVLNHPQYVSLKDFIGDIERNKLEARRIKVRAKEAIVKKTREKCLFEKPRPFGWEDLWAYS